MEATYDSLTNTANNPDTTRPGRSETGEAAGFFEAILSDGEAVDELICDPSSLDETLHRLVALAVLGLVVYGIALGAVLQILAAGEPHLSVPGTPVLWVPPTVAGGFVAAIAICLPAFYFYTQLSGLDASFRLVTAQSLRVQARTSVMLLGVLPFWLTWALTPFIGIDAVVFDPMVVLAAGFVVPFAVGFSGLWSVYNSFKRLVDRIPITNRRRGNFVLRLVTCWAAVMCAVTPVAMYRIGEFLSGVL